MVVQDFFHKQWEPTSTSVCWLIFSLYIFVSLDITSLLCKGDVLAGKELFAECWSYSTCHGWNSCFHGHRWCGQHHSWGRRVAGASHNGRGLFSAGPSWAQEGWNSGSLTFLCTSTYLTRIWTLLSSHMGWERSIASERGTVFLWPYFLTHPWIFVPKSTRRGTLVYVQSYIGIQNATLRYLFLSIPTHWWTVTKFLLGRTTIRSSAWDENRRKSLARLMDSKRQFHRIADQTTWHKLVKKQSHTAVSQSRESRRGTCFSIIFNCVGRSFWW